MIEAMMTMQSKTMRNRFYQPSGSHPYEHKMRLKSASSALIPGFTPERSLTVTNFQLTPRTTFEMERPQTQGSPKLVVINTSFRTPYQDRNINNRRRVPTFPKLATDHSTPRNVSRLTNVSNTSVMRQPSAGNSSQRKDLGSATNRLSASMSRSNREISALSDRRTDSARAQLTKRQSNTFTQYAKYNDYVNSTKAREKASESNITSNINDLGALIPKRTQTELLLSTEKHLWISDWVESTSAALRLNPFVEDDASQQNKTLSVIQEY